MPQDAVTGVHTTTLLEQAPLSLGQLYRFLAHIDDAKLRKVWQSALILSLTYEGLPDGVVGQVARCLHMVTAKDQAERRAILRRCELSVRRRQQSSKAFEPRLLGDLRGLVRTVGGRIRLNKLVSADQFARARAVINETSDFRVELSRPPKGRMFYEVVRIGETP